MTQSKLPDQSFLKRFLRARLAPDHPLGLPLTTGILALLACTLLFALVGYEVHTHGAITRLDQTLADWFNRHAFPPLTQAVLGYTHLHGTIGVLVMGALLLRHMLRARQWPWVIALVLVLPGGMLLNVALKHVFARLRPHFEDPILVLHSYSFPSGHTIGATLFYATLAAYLLNPPGRSPVRGGRRVAIIGGAALLVVLTGLSRIYLGAHFFSDVVGAALLGMAWFALWTTVVFTLQRHYCGRAHSN
ncbi:MAG: phosphatase PAP2 family protein [Herbaspirillum sp.]|nr:phosphatase PAP2 family protein [Herbaspirillum sp.]